MKKTISITLIFLCAIAIRGFAQVRQSAEIMPQFEGSTNGLKQWLAENMKYPEEAIQNKEEGRVTVNFVVMEDGSIAQPMIANGVSRSLDAEALRLVAAMPKWIPASQDGQPCAVEYSLPIRFNLPTTSQRVPNQSVQNTSKPQRKEWKLLPNHKMYEGPFEAFGLFEEDGNAKYQYIENYDGTRVFDGPFEYRGTDFEVHGQFKNDYQVGRWTFTSEGKTTSIYFSSNGQPSSSFVLYDILCEFYTDGRLIGKASFRGPAFSGEIESYTKSNYTFRTIESTTSNGYEVHYGYTSDIENGRWHEVRIDGYIIGRKDIHWDKSMGFYRIDDRTGERMFDIQLGYGDPDPNLAVIRMNHYLLRKTKRDYWR